MDRAIALAHKAALRGEIPVGAVVVKDGEIIGEGYNRREELSSPSAHAEIMAIESAAKSLSDWRRSGCSLYVTLEPCPMCAGAIAMSGIERVYFGAYDLRMGCAGSVYSLPEDSALGVHIPCVGGVCEQDCAKLVTDFFTVRRT